MRLCNDQSSGPSFGHPVARDARSSSFLTRKSCLTIPYRADPVSLESQLLFLKQVIEGRACVTRTTNLRRRRDMHHWRGSVPVPRNRYPRAEQLAFVDLILNRYPRRNGPQALEPRGRLKVGALFAAMQRRGAFRTIPLEIRPGRQCRGAVVTARCRHALHQPRQTRTRRVLQSPWTLRRPGPVISILSARLAVRVLVPVLPVLAIVIHGYG